MAAARPEAHDREEGAVGGRPFRSDNHSDSGTDACGGVMEPILIGIPPSHFHRKDRQEREEHRNGRRISDPSQHLFEGLIFIVLVTALCLRVFVVATSGRTRWRSCGYRRRTSPQVEDRGFPFGGADGALPCAFGHGDGDAVVVNLEGADPHALGSRHRWTDHHQHARQVDAV